MWITRLTRLIFTVVVGFLGLAAVDILQDDVAYNRKYYSVGSRLRTNKDDAVMSSAQQDNNNSNNNKPKIHHETTIKVADNEYQPPPFGSPPTPILLSTFLFGPDLYQRRLFRLFLATI